MTELDLDAIRERPLNMFGSVVLAPSELDALVGRIQEVSDELDTLREALREANKRDRIIRLGFMNGTLTGDLAGWIASSDAISREAPEQYPFTDSTGRMVQP